MQNKKKHFFILNSINIFYKNTYLAYDKGKEATIQARDPA